jgi:Domain of unknown function (DUF1992)
VTERKPQGMTFRSWIDQQISEAAERGAFDNLSGAGRPLPSKPDPDGLAWLRDYVRREGVSTDELLPTPLKLRKQAHRLTETAQTFRSEQEVRDAVAELNFQIKEWRRIPLGPPVFVPLVDEEALVRTWRDSRKATTATPAPASAGADEQQPAEIREPRTWRRRRRRR